MKSTFKGFIKDCGWNQKQTANRLGVGLRTVNRWCSNSGSNPPRMAFQAMSWHLYEKSLNVHEDISEKIIPPLITTKCPECGSLNCRDIVDSDLCYRVCANCNQEWFTDVDYSSIVNDI